MNPTVEIAGFIVNRVGLGAMRLCGPRVIGLPRDPANALRVLRRAVELGVGLIDTSDAYGPHVNEEQIAEALWPYPPNLLIATKGGYTRPGGAWVPDGHPAHLRAACEGSLKRLRLEAIDLYQLHHPDPNVPFEESVGELARLRREGKIRHCGLSNVGAEQLEAAQSIVPIGSVQNHYNLGDRSSEDVLEACERRKIPFLPYFPLDAGDLAKAGGALARIAPAHAATRSQIALAWLLRRSPFMLPIPGTSSVAHLEENVKAGAVELSDDEFEALAA